jgi:para-nitrobenzyl esterase
MRTVDDDVRILELYRSVLGVDDDATLRAVPADAMVAAVPEMIGRTAEWGRYLPVFQPHVDGRYLRASVWDNVATHAPDTEIMIGWTSREFAFFFGREPGPEDGPPARLIERMRWSFGDAAEKAFDRYQDLYRTDSVLDLLTGYAGDEMFRIPCLDRAAALAAQGLRVHAFEFGMPLTGDTSVFGGAHCLELPFVLGTYDAMRGGDAVLTRDVDADTARAATNSMRSAWLGYARDGDPAVGATAGWKPFTADAPHGMVFCEPRAVAAPTGDLNGPLRAVWADLRV